MRQISGAMPGGGPPRVHCSPAAEVAQQGGVQVAVLRHNRTSQNAHDLLRAYLRAGAPAVHERRADGTVVIADAASGRLVLARDSVGTTPLYWGRRSGDFAFGTHCRDVLDSLALDAHPDRAALAALLVDHAAAPLDRTYFGGVNAVPPGSTLVCARGGAELLTPTQPPVAAAALSYHEAVERFAALLRAAVANRLDTQGTTAVLVSGGLDSAALACLAVQHGDVFGITYVAPDDPAADESRYIEMLRVQGLCIERVPFYPTSDAAALEQSIRQTEMPMADVVPLTLQRAQHLARGRGARVLLTGTWGDQVLSPFPPAHLGALSPWRAAGLAERYQQYLVDVPIAEVRRALVRQSLRQRTPRWLLQTRRKWQRRESTFDVLAHEFEAVPATMPSSFAAAVRANAGDAAQVRAIEATTKSGWAGQLDVRLPFLDRELLQFLVSLSDDVAYHEHRLKPLLRDALRGVVPDALLDRRDKGDYTSAIRRGQLPLSMMLELMDDLRRPVEFGLMSRRSAAKTLARLRTGSNIAEREDEAMTLLALDIWLRLFFQSTP